MLIQISLLESEQIYLKAALVLIQIHMHAVAMISLYIYFLAFGIESKFEIASKQFKLKFVICSQQTYCFQITYTPKIFIKSRLTHPI